MDIKFDSNARLPRVATVSTAANGRPAADSQEPPVDVSPPKRVTRQGVAQLQDHVQTVRRELHFRVDEVTGLTVIRVVDAHTGELVRQVPSQDVLDMIDSLDSGSGLVLRERV